MFQKPESVTKIMTIMKKVYKRKLIVINISRYQSTPSCGLVFCSSSSRLLQLWQRLVPHVIWLFNQQHGQELWQEMYSSMRGNLIATSICLDSVLMWVKNIREVENRYFLRMTWCLIPSTIHLMSILLIHLFKSSKMSPPTLTSVSWDHRKLAKSLSYQLNSIPFQPILWLIADKTTLVSNGVNPIALISSLKILLSQLQLSTEVFRWLLLNRLFKLNSSFKQ